MKNTPLNRIPFREGIFTEGPDGGSLLASRCRSCGESFFPKLHVCFNCGSKDMDEFTLSPRGKLNTYTTAYMPSMYFEPPYAIGYVDMPEGMRIFSPLKILKEKPFRIDMEMELIIEELWQEGENQVIGYRFRPV